MGEPTDCLSNRYARRLVAHSFGISEKLTGPTGGRGAESGSVWHTVATVEPCDFAVGYSALQK